MAPEGTVAEGLVREVCLVPHCHLTQLLHFLHIVSQKGGQWPGKGGPVARKLARKRGPVARKLVLYCNTLFLPHSHTLYSKDIAICNVFN